MDLYTVEVRYWLLITSSSGCDLLKSFDIAYSTERGAVMRSSLLPFYLLCLAPLFFNWLVAEAEADVSVVRVRSHSNDMPNHQDSAEGRSGHHRHSNSRWHLKSSVKQEQRQHLEAVMQNSSTPIDVRWRIFKTLYDRRFNNHEEKMRFILLYRT